MKHWLIATTLSIVSVSAANASSLPTPTKPAAPAKPAATPAGTSSKHASKPVHTKKSSTTDKEPAAGTDLVINGGFEISPHVGHGWKHLDAPNTEIYGWQVYSGNVDLFEGIPSIDGSKCVDLNGQEPGVIRQAIKTRPGMKYRMKVMAGGHPMGGGNTKILFLRAAEQEKAWMFENDKFVHGGDPGYREFAFDFSAREPITVIEVGSRNDGGGGPVIDAVSVVKIGKGTPVPASAKEPTASTKAPLPAGTPSMTDQGPKSAPTATGANLIVNGSFENSVDPGGGWQHYDAGSTAIYGWLVATGEVDLWGGIKTPFGKKTIDLDGQRAGSVMQSIRSEPGSTYRLRFYVGSFDHQSKNVFARAAGKKLLWNINVLGSTENPVFREVIFEFKARDKTTAIEIGSATEGTQGPVLDNVSCVKIGDTPAESEVTTQLARPPIGPMPKFPTEEVAPPAAATTPAPPVEATPAPTPAQATPPPSPVKSTATTGSAKAEEESEEESPAQRKARRKAEEAALKEALRRKREEEKNAGYYGGLNPDSGK